MEKKLESCLYLESSSKHYGYDVFDKKGNLLSIYIRDIEEVKKIMTDKRFVSKVYEMFGRNEMDIIGIIHVEKGLRYVISKKISQFEELVIKENSISKRLEAIELDEYQLEIR